ncbi:carotenoid oxygenase family protein [Caulobacter segnis]
MWTSTASGPSCTAGASTSRPARPPRNTWTTGCWNSARVQPKYAGKPYRYAYSTTSKPGWFLFNGFVQARPHDRRKLDDRPARRRLCQRGPVRPKVGAVDEDDGYLVSFLIDENRGTSECAIVDAKTFRIVCRIALPHKLSSGTHSVWAGREMLRG